MEILNCTVNIRDDRLRDDFLEGSIHDLYITDVRPEQETEHTDESWDYKIKINQERGMFLQAIIDLLPHGSVIMLNEGTYTIPERRLSFNSASPVVSVVGASGRGTTIRSMESVLEEGDENKNEWDEEAN
jgi:hypothetical protein